MKVISIRAAADARGCEEGHAQFPRLDLPLARREFLKGSGVLVGKGRAEPYTNGTGYGHIGVVVDDVAATHRELLAAGHAPTPVKEFRRGEEL
ncbi:MAG: lactoylglutathione lyase, partial [Betaproteobacteria bacterium]